MKHNKFLGKRGIALFVSVMMCLSAMSTTAWAASFTEVQDKIDAAGSGDTVDLWENVSVSNEDGGAASITVSGKDVTLNLNGWTMTGNGTDSVIRVENGGDLTLKDEKTDDANTAEGAVGTITGGGGKPAYGGSDGGGIYVAGGSNVTMAGGKVTGNTATWGGGVMVRGDGSSFTMTGGEISGNTATQSGGGVFARDKVNVVLDGGTISENETVQNGGGGSYGGGGVYVQNKAEFTMKSGSISNNTSAANTTDAGKGASGGGVYVENGKFTMTGGEISGNEAKGIGEGGGIYGKGTSTVISMEGGKISGNKANSSWGGGGVRVWSGAGFEMTGGELTGNEAPNVAEKTDWISVSTADNGSNVGKATITGGTIDGYAERYIPEQGYGVLVIDAVDRTVKVVKHDLETYYGEHLNVVETPATCTAEGTRTFQCSVENCTLNHKETIAKIDHDWQAATCEKPQTCKECGATEGVALGHDMTVTVLDRAATCEEEGARHLKCSRCEHTESPTSIAKLLHTEVIDEAVPATCTTAGLAEGKHCSVCDAVIVARQESEEALGHDFNGEVTLVTPATVYAEGLELVSCTRCDATQERAIPRLVPTPGDDPTDDPGTITIDPEPVPMGDAPGTATIADTDVPLAGIVTLAQLLDELYRHEGAPEVVLPEGFPFAEHEYAAAICWGLDNALVINTEEEPLDPDVVVTVGLMREVLINFVAYKGVEEFTVELEGEDEEIVLDLGDRLIVFYADLEAARVEENSEEE